MLSARSEATTHLNQHDSILQHMQLNNMIIFGKGAERKHKNSQFVLKSCYLILRIGRDRMSPPPPKKNHTTEQCSATLVWEEGAAQALTWWPAGDDEAWSSSLSGPWRRSPPTPAPTEYTTWVSICMRLIGCLSNHSKKRKIQYLLHYITYIELNDLAREKKQIYFLLFNFLRTNLDYK